MKADPIVAEATRQFRQELSELLRKWAGEELAPPAFAGLISGLKAVSNRAALTAFTRSVEARQDDTPMVERDGQRHRFKHTSSKSWLTPFGLAVVSRRYYQPDVGGRGVIPIDEQCGMVDRYCTPDVEEMVAFASALMVPREVETLLGKALAKGPSATAIGRVPPRRDRVHPTVSATRVAAELRQGALVRALQHQQPHAARSGEADPRRARRQLGKRACRERTG